METEYVYDYFENLSKSERIELLENLASEYDIDVTVWND